MMKTCLQPLIQNKQVSKLINYNDIYWLAWGSVAAAVCYGCVHLEGHKKWFWWQAYLEGFCGKRGYVANIHKAGPNIIRKSS